MMMINAARAVVRPTNPQRRTIINWLVKYPDTILEQRAFHQKSHGYTWQRWPQDKYINAFGVVLALAGIAQLVPGYYRLATGKGKRE